MESVMSYVAGRHRRATGHTRGVLLGGTEPPGSRCVVAYINLACQTMISPWNANWSTRRGYRGTHMQGHADTDDDTQ